jgi:hypothetical protein
MLERTLSRRDLCAITLTSQTLHTLTKPILYHRVVLNMQLPCLEVSLRVLEVVTLPKYPVNNLALLVP